MPSGGKNKKKWVHFLPIFWQGCVITDYKLKPSGGTESRAARWESLTQPRITVYVLFCLCWAQSFVLNLRPLTSKQNQMTCPSITRGGQRPELAWPGPFVLNLRPLTSSKTRWYHQRSSHHLTFNFFFRRFSSKRFIGRLASFKLSFYSSPWYIGPTLPTRK